AVPSSPRAAAPPAYDPAPAPRPGSSYDYAPSAGSRSRFPGAGGLAILAGMLGLGGWTAYRYRSRKCPSCKNPMIRLGEVQDDAHLTPPEATEERIGSVDYDVWACASCDHVAKLRYGRLFSGYSECPACQTKALSSRSTTVQAATYTHGGLVRIDRDCAHCGHKDSSTRSTPRRVQQRRTSSFSSGGGSRSGGFGGGRSSGRGASGRW
ncbi:MAG TPA: TPM domain-containing protein, partial [Thermoanaerobaculia bacterium]|nr:TPM domain-containing protein [Thermoanaerobaculia bacterium]